MQLVEITTNAGGKSAGCKATKLLKRTFTWILTGRGMPSFSSLVFSLKSLQNCPMGIPLWIGRGKENKEGNKHWENCGRLL